MMGPEEVTVRRKGLLTPPLPLPLSVSPNLCNLLVSLKNWLFLSLPATLPHSLPPSLSCTHVHTLAASLAPTPPAPSL